ncbi:L,D-transpeptidase [Saccharibacillus sp. JS10]|uniref:L,D-transpeptidase n=1 Tax=Saccharibacillus sp. JS10 TaxID=2950552 RepID=UPI00210CBEA2|nr:L,D-transpeptidase [Saccharibacillus sp. JS10]MCQ4087032.1 L,D-transpeptidase [Saccharibacillus sp. JS10]
MSRFRDLKQYVREHPDNKMAWYLLGKEYEADGQEGKANYCFNQAQEIYEAYEHVHVPEDILAEYEEKLQEAARKRKKVLARRRAWLLAAVLLLLIGFRYAHAPPASSSAALEKAAAASSTVFTAAEIGEPKAIGLAAASYLEDGRQFPASVLGMRRSGQWLLWNSKMPVIAQLEPGEGTEESLIRNYDPTTCDCEADVSKQEQQAAQAWVNEQESLATLSSAITQYRQKEKGFPEDLQSLNQSFPNNVMSGSTPVMSRFFDRYAAMLKRQVYGQDIPSLAEGGRPVSAETLGGQPYLNQPLEIVVDRSRHRLAVVSGNILLRSYEVGLGGSKTPTGTFEVTDKVVNPNGKSNGEFGSRGMQLSDTDYAIHGTNEPSSIGGDESHGCVRMNVADVEELFDMVPKGTKVTLTDNVLPEEIVVPQQRFQTQDRQDQTNNKKVYHWLN